jgi:hypothetical protein
LPDPHRFPSFADGRGFTLARRLRRWGYAGGCARRAMCWPTNTPWRGGPALTRSRSTMISPRQPEDQWRARADWRAHDYQSRLRG